MISGANGPTCSHMIYSLVVNAAMPTTTIAPMSNTQLSDDSPNMVKSSDTAHVRFRGQSGHATLRCICLLLTQSGQRPLPECSPKPIRCDVSSLGGSMRRREFITFLGGATVAWPLAARAQQPERMRRIGALINLAEDDREAQAQHSAFLQALQQLGWTD